MSSRAQPLPRDGVRLTTRAGILAIVVALLLLLLIAPVREYLSQKDGIAVLRRQTALLEEANADLEEEVAKLGDAEELERLARECLGMVRPGETAFVTVPKDGTSVPPRC